MPIDRLELIIVNRISDRNDFKNVSNTIDLLLLLLRVIRANFAVNVAADGKQLELHHRPDRSQLYVFSEANCRNKEKVDLRQKLSERIEMEKQMLIDKRTNQS